MSFPRRDGGRPAGLPERPRATDADRIWGLHAVAAAWANPERICHALWLSDGAAEALARQLTVPEGVIRPKPAVVDRATLDRMVGKAAVHQGAVLDCALLEEVDLTDILIKAANPERRERSVVVVLDQVTDPQNVGAVLRSSAAFGGLAVIAPRRQSPPLTGTLVKAASGGVERCPYVRVHNLNRALEQMKAEHFRLVGLDERGEATVAAAMAEGDRLAIILGAEGEGLRQSTRAACDALIRLPTLAGFSSLNVSNAAAVALYEATRARV